MRLGGKPSGANGDASGASVTSPIASAFAGARAISAAPLLAMSSQAVGMVQLFLMLLRHGATNATDVYLYLFNLGNLPNQIVAVGVLYPLLLSPERLSRRRARAIRILLPISATAVMLGGAAWLQVNGRFDGGTLLIALLCLINAWIQAGIWPMAVAAEASGDPRWMAGVALPANVVACLGLLVPSFESTSEVSSMVGGLVLGNVLLLALMLSKRVGSEVFLSLSAANGGGSRSQWWFGGKSAVGYGGLVVIQSIALILPPSSLTLVAIPTKVVGAISVALVNAVMPHFVNQKSSSSASGARFLGYVWIGLLPIVIVLGAVTQLTAPAWLSVVLVVGLWSFGSTGAAGAQRMAFRFLPASASAVTMVVLPTIVVAVWATSITGGLSVVSLLCAYALIDSISGAIWFQALKLKPFTLAMVLNSVVLLGMWVVAAW